MTDGPPSSDRLARYRSSLSGLDRRSRLRRLAPRDGLDFASNDYLALASSGRLAAAVAEAIGRGVPVGAAGSRLLRGNHPEHEALEAEAAAFFGADAALYLGSGYAANVALFTALPQRGDLVVHDELIHASVHEGLRTTKADVAAARHNDAAAFEAAILDWRGRGGTGLPFLAVESVYSMDGDRAPLDALMAIAERHGGFLVVDEAHGTGVFGPDGRGLSAPFEGREALVALHTCGKALGTGGALVTAASELIQTLVNRAKPFIYATAPSPLLAAATREALRILADEPERRAALDGRVRRAEAALAGLGLSGSGSQIQPVILGGNARAAAVAAAVQAEGFDCRAIRPPTVPEGTARLRISLTLNVTEADVEALVAAIGREMDRVG